MKTDSILILDFGSQYNQLIARRIREKGVHSLIKPCQVSFEEIKGLNPKGIVLSGGPSSVYDKNSPVCDKAIFNLGVPVLAICYGMQLVTQFFGGTVESGIKSEYGKTFFEADSVSPLFKDIPSRMKVWMSHGDQVVKMPPGFIKTGSSDNTSIAAFMNLEKHLFGLQFHPEVTHTDHGTQMIENFLFEICRCTPNWSMDSFISETITHIQNTVGEKDRVICGLSGGVDSTVASVLIHRAIGDRLTCVLVDNGLLRKNEANKISGMIRSNFGITLLVANAEEKFLSGLTGITDPEIKRKTIGRIFIDVFEDQAKKAGHFRYLAQGTLYPDVIESVSAKGGPTATIKSHHNVGGLPEKMNLALIEPLRELFKDEVRKVGRILGIPEDIIGRQPFPGPGLAVRILGEVTKERCDILREADSIVVEEIKKAGLYKKIWQSFAILLPLKTVGVMGDSRTYENVVAIRAVESSDGMTADWVRLPYDLLGHVSNRIINEVDGVNRVVFDVSSKPPATIEWE
ncbi:MAG: glutamine-hydrolyzing GMP synthase [Candidatus Aureabacteria bacterium]|nr:glutamine-hydrolyzing GMP synthase [Candidatus Auribacterota bacterium]